MTISIRSERLVRALAMGATALLASACIKARTDPVTGKVAMDVRSPLQKGDVWTAKMAGAGPQASATGDARAEVYQGQANVTVRLSGLAPGNTHPWRVYQGRCSEPGGPIGEADAYPALSPNEQGVADGAARLTVPLEITRKYKVRVFASQMDPTTVVACGDLSLQ